MASGPRVREASLPLPLLRPLRQLLLCPARLDRLTRGCGGYQRSKWAERRFDGGRQEVKASQALHELICLSHQSSFKRLVEELIKLYPDAVKRKDYLRGMLPIHTALHCKAPEDVMVLLLNEYPAGARERDNDGNLPLRWAVQCKAPSSIVALLLHENPEAVKEKDKDGDLPLHWAVEYEAPEEVVALLLRAYPEGARQRNAASNLPIHEAALSKASEGTMALLLHDFPEGASEKGEFQHYPLQMAITRRSSSSIMSMLVDSYKPAIMAIETTKLQHQVKSAAAEGRKTATQLSLRARDLLESAEVLLGRGKRPRSRSSTPTSQDGQPAEYDEDSSPSKRPRIPAAAEPTAVGSPTSSSHGREPTMRSALSRICRPPHSLSPASSPQQRSGSGSVTRKGSGRSLLSPSRSEVPEAQSSCSSGAALQAVPEGSHPRRRQCESGAACRPMSSTCCSKLEAHASMCEQPEGPRPPSATNPEHPEAQGEEGVPPAPRSVPLPESTPQPRLQPEGQGAQALQALPTSGGFPQPSAQLALASEAGPVLVPSSSGTLRPEEPPPLVKGPAPQRDACASPSHALAGSLQHHEAQSSVEGGAVLTAQREVEAPRPPPLSDGSEQTEPQALRVREDEPRPHPSSSIVQQPASHSTLCRESSPAELAASGGEEPPQTQPSLSGATTEVSGPLSAASQQPEGQSCPRSSSETTAVPPLQRLRGPEAIFSPCGRRALQTCPSSSRPQPRGPVPCVCRTALESASETDEQLQQPSCSVEAGSPRPVAATYESSPEDSMPSASEWLRSLDWRRRAPRADVEGMARLLDRHHDLDLSLFLTYTADEEDQHWEDLQRFFFPSGYFTPVACLIIRQAIRKQRIEPPAPWGGALVVRRSR